MNRTFRTSLELATIAAVAVSCHLPLTAGTIGAYMNSAGYGKAADSVTFGTLASKATSISMYYPCAAVAPASTFTCNLAYTAKLPQGTPATVYCQSKGGPNYVWSIQSYVTGGATADNPELEARITIPSADCASYTLESEATFTDAYSGSITISSTATSGAAIWVRGYEFLGTGEPDSLEELKSNGRLKFDLLIPGPFVYDKDTCTALTIPFVTETGHQNLYFVADGVAKSTPFAMTCPRAVVYGCDEVVVYPTPTVTGGCGNITVTYSPPPSALPAAVTTVTATATDEAGNTASCTFVADASAKAFAIICPSDVNYGCIDAVVYPAAEVRGGCGSVTVAYSPPASALAVGVPTVVTVTATDSLGRTANCNFTATRSSSLRFIGFGTPIGGMGGTCATPFRAFTVGTVLPVKFLALCVSPNLNAGTPLTTGTATLAIKNCSTSTPAGGGNFVYVSGQWNFNWNTAGLAKGSYELVATLQDGSTRTVFIQLK